MKKTLFTLATAIILSPALFAQEPAANFDDKFRFGLRVTPQPTWFVSNDKNNIPAGAKFGIGFGLNMEWRLSKVVGFLTGIGGDFEGGRITFKYDPANNYEVRYWMNEANEFVIPSKDAETSPTNTGYLLRERDIRTTHATIPLILKLSTQEYSGIKYFGMFGAELGIRLKSTAKDVYYQTTKYSAQNQKVEVVALNETQTDINIQGESSLIPMRFGLNAGLGGEYRLGGSTSLLLSINYFRSFTNLMRKEANYMIYREEAGSYKYVKQGLKMTAIRINIGIMF